MNKRQKLIFHWSIYFLIGVIILAAIVSQTEFGKDPAALNDDGSVGGLTHVLDRKIDDKMKKFQFVEASHQAGIDFKHFQATRASLLPEDMGSGLAWGDYNNDGYVDLFLVNFQGNINQPNGKTHALFENKGDGTFKNVTALVGLNQASFGMAAAWGDFDNDHDLDLYISNYGANQLYRNDGDHGFVEISKTAGVADAGFGAGISWGDFNNDGLIDLYVCNYVEFINDGSPETELKKQYNTDIPFTLNPSSYEPAANRLYQNSGDGTFKEVAKAAGVDNITGRSLVAAWFDFDNDGLQDLYVANDISENGVYHNNGKGGFDDIGASSLAADYRGAMGLAVGDFDNDADLDLFVTHWLAQENALFKNNVSMNWKDEAGDKKIFFVDESEIMGLGQISLKTVGWSTSFTDFDNDGLLDLWVVNGSTMQQDKDNTQLVAQNLQLFRQEPQKGFYDISNYAGEGLNQAFVGRGGAQADYNQDGKMDLAIMRYGDSPLLLKNTATNSNNWINIKLTQTSKNTQALGAKIKVRTGAIWHTSQVGSQGSYLSQNDTEQHFGLGNAKTVDEVIINWPDGEQQKLDSVYINTTVEVTHKPHY